MKTAPKIPTRRQRDELARNRLMAKLERHAAARQGERLDPDALRRRLRVS